MTSPPNFLGINNYTTLFQDTLFIQSLRVTAPYAFSAVAVGLVLSLAIAVLLNQRIVFRGAFQTIIYLPTVVSGMVVVLLWEWILNPSFGIVNYLLSLIHLPGPLWFQDETWVIPAFVALSIWALGGQMIVFLAAL